MTAFCVLGITLNDCRKLAEKKVPQKDPQTKQLLTIAEWRDRVDALAAEIFESHERSKQISPAFDAPQFANDWIGVAERTVRAKAMRIMTRGEKKDKKGIPLVRKGKVVIGWVPYAQ